MTARIPAAEAKHEKDYAGNNGQVSGITDQAVQGSGNTENLVK